MVILGWTKVEPPEVQPIMGIFLCVSVFHASFGFPIQLAVTKPSEINYGPIMRHMECVMEPKEHDEIMISYLKIFAKRDNMLKAIFSMTLF